MFKGTLIEVVMVEELSREAYKCFMDNGYIPDPRELFIQKMAKYPVEIPFIIEVVNKTNWEQVGNYLTEWFTQNPDLPTSELPYV